MKKQYIERYFDDYAIKYGEILSPDSVHIQYIAKQIRSRIPLEKLSIIDLGTGNGRLMKAIGLKNCLYYGIDVSEKQLKIAEINMTSERLDAYLIKSDMSQGIPLGDSLGDLVISNAAIHHIQNKKHLLEDIYRILKKEGQVFLFDYYYGFVDPEIIQSSLELRFKCPDMSAKFLKALHGEHRTRTDKKMPHPVEFHKSPLEISDLMKQIGFSQCETIPTFCDEYIGIYGKRM